MTSSDYRQAFEACWQCNLETRGERLAASFRHGKLTDLTIVFPGHHEKIRAHRFVLAISSPVFERMFYGPLAEGEELKLPEDPPEAFKWLLNHIYFGNTKFYHVSLGVKVYHLAKKYQMDALASLCSRFLRVNLHPRNLPLIMDTAMLHEDKLLLEKCSEVISREAEAVFNSSYLGQINRISLEHLLQHHFTLKSEVTVFRGLVNWGKAQINSDVKEPDGAAVRKEIEGLLPYIRFLTMSLDEFVKHVMPTGIISAEECNNILMNIKQIPGVQMPPICSKKRKMRKDCVTSRKRSRRDSRRNCLVSSPHSSPPSPNHSFCSYSPADTPNSSPQNSTNNSANSLFRSPTPERSRHSSQSSRHSYRSSRHSPASSRHSSRSSQRSYRSRHSSRSSHHYYQSPPRSPSRSPFHSSGTSHHYYHSPPRSPSRSPDHSSGTSHHYYQSPPHSPSRSPYHSSRSSYHYYQSPSRSPSRSPYRSSPQSPTHSYDFSSSDSP